MICALLPVHIWPADSIFLNAGYKPWYEGLWAWNALCWPSVKRFSGLITLICRRQEFMKSQVAVRTAAELNACARRSSSMLIIRTTSSGIRNVFKVQPVNISGPHEHARTLLRQYNYGSRQIQVVRFGPHALNDHPTPDGLHAPSPKRQKIDADTTRVRPIRVKDLTGMMLLPRIRETRTSHQREQCSSHDQRYSPTQPGRIPLKPDDIRSLRQCDGNGFWTATG